MARLTADDWIRAATIQLANGGIETVRVERLAKALKVSKGSFYWHFEDRQALLTAILEAWEQQGTLQIIETVDREASAPAERLWALFQQVFGGPLEFDAVEAAMRAWAAVAPQVKRVVRRVDQQRLSYVVELLVAAGIPGDEAKRRSELLYCTLMGEFLQRTYGKARLGQRALRSFHAMMLMPGS
ncbi:MAG: TetR/AcrR family transcriptional regulator [Myxococcota bacterium]